MNNEGVSSASAFPLMTRRLQLPLNLLLDRAFDWLIALFLFITIFLPSGSIYGLNIKSPFYLALLPLAAFSVFRHGYATRERLASFLCVPLILSIWVLVGLVNGFALAGVLRQFTDILLVLLLCWLVLVYCRDEELRRIRFLRVALNAEILTCMFKVGIVCYALIRGIPTVELVAQLSIAFGVNLMTMDLGALFGRVQFVSDAIIPVCIFIVLRHRERLNIGNLRAAITTLLLLISVILSFSRYLWAFTALAFLIGLVMGKRDRFQLILSSLLLLSVLASLPALVSLYELRFSEDVAGSSDLIRVEQIAALKEFFTEAPLIGHGLGSYTNRVVREQETGSGVRYSYEAQLLALAGQVGVSGLLFLLLLGMYYYSDLIAPSGASLKDRIVLLILLGSWIAAGLYNPLLFHPIAGVNYAIFAALAAITKTPQIGTPTENQPITA